MIDPFSLAFIGAAVTKLVVGAKVVVPAAKAGVPAAKATVSFVKFLGSVCKGVSAGSTASVQTGVTTGKAALSAAGSAVGEYNKNRCFPPGPTGIPGECPRIPI